MSNQWTDEQKTNWKQAYTSVIEFGRSALTSSAFLNGGAAVAIVAAATAAPKTIKIADFLWVLLSFSLGAAFALLSLGFAYYAEFCLLQQNRGSESQPEYKKYEYPVRVGAIASGLLSFFLFVGGILLAFYALAPSPEIQEESSMVRPAIRYIAEPDSKGEWYVYPQGASVAIKGPMSEAAAKKRAAGFTAKELLREFYEWALEERAEKQREMERRRDDQEREKQRQFFEELLEENERIQELINEIIDQILNPAQDDDERIGPKPGM